MSLLLLLESFLTRLSSPPFLSLGQIRLSCIPDIPAAYVRNSIRLLWARTVSSTPPFPSLYPSPVSSLYLHLVCTGRGGRGFTVRFTLPFSSPPSSLSFSGFIRARDSDMTASVEGLETGFYTRGNGVKRDNAQSNTQKTELIWDVHSLPRQGGIRKRKAKWSRAAGCACQREKGMMVCKQEGVKEPMQGGIIDIIEPELQDLFIYLERLNIMEKYQ